MYRRFPSLGEKNFLLCVLFWQNGHIFASLFKKGADSVAQPVEQYTFNVWVLGSNPSGITNE